MLHCPHGAARGAAGGSGGPWQPSGHELLPAAVSVSVSAPGSRVSHRFSTKNDFPLLLLTPLRGNDALREKVCGCSPGPLKGKASGLTLLRDGAVIVVMLGFVLWTFDELGISLKFSKLLSSRNSPVLRRAGAGQRPAPNSDSSVCCYLVLTLALRFIRCPSCRNPG